jgi:hypothetical protein
LELKKQISKLTKLIDKHVYQLNPVLGQVKEVLACGSAAQLDDREREQTEFKASDKYLFYLRVEAEKAKGLKWDKIASALPALNLREAALKTRYHEVTRTMRMLGIQTGDAPVSPKVLRVSEKILHIYTPHGLTEYLDVSSSLEAGSIDILYGCYYSLG